MTSSFRQSAGLKVGDHITMSPYLSPIEEAKEVILQPEENTNATPEREAIGFYLRNELGTNMVRI